MPFDPTRRCSKCNMDLPVCEFRVYKRKKRLKQQIAYWCNRCQLSYQKERLSALKEAGICTNCGKAKSQGITKCATCASARYKYVNTYNANLRKEVLAKYGNRCVCCGESEFKFLTLDHVNNDGAKHRAELKRDISGPHGRGGGRSRDLLMWAKKNNYPDSLQILCYNCNCGKERNGQVCCPHQVSATIFITLKPVVLSTSRS